MILDPSVAVAIAVTFVWIGMLVAISFVEAPLKFRAPGITIPLGLGIGRLVFRALNLFELLWAVVLFACVIIGGLTTTAPGMCALGAVAALLIGVVIVRPRLNRRSDAVLAAAVAGRVSGPGESTGPRSRAHLVYVVLEVIKLGLLLAAGIGLLGV